MNEMFNNYQDFGIIFSKKSTANLTYIRSEKAKDQSPTSSLFLIVKNSIYAILKLVLF